MTERRKKVKSSCRSGQPLECLHQNFVVLGKSSAKDGYACAYGGSVNFEFDGVPIFDREPVQLSDDFLSRSAIFDFLVVVNEHVVGSLAATGRHAKIVLEEIGTAGGQTHWVDFAIDHDLRPQAFFDDGAILDPDLSRDGINVRWVRLHGRRCQVDDVYVTACHDEHEWREQANEPVSMCGLGC